MISQMRIHHDNKKGFRGNFVLIHSVNPFLNQTTICNAIYAQIVLMLPLSLCDLHFKI